MDLSTVRQLRDLEVESKRVLVRADLDVPLAGGEIADDKRIRRALRTIETLVEMNARVILMAHLGNPGGKADPFLSLEPVAARLADLLASGEIVLTDGPVGDGVKRVALDLRDGQVALLENLRFHSGETRNDEKFARELARYGEVFVADGIRSLVESCASTTLVPRLLAQRAVGLDLGEDLKSANAILNTPERPFVAVVGGRSFSEKLGLIQSLMERADSILLGGAVANTFMTAKVGAMGRTPVQAEKLAIARALMRQASNAEVRFFLPTDVIVASDADAPEGAQTTVDAVPDDQIIVDIGDATRARFKDIVARAKTVFWNGAMGDCERAPFAEGSMAMARAIAGSAAFSVVDGDDSMTMVEKSGLEKGFNHVSTGDGALSRLIQGQVLPGLKPLLAH